MTPRQRFRESLRAVAVWAYSLVPGVAALLTFAGGTMLLVSGALPHASERMLWLAHVLPLPIVEVSHFLGSVIGAALLLLSWGLRRRLDAAYVTAIGLLGMGIFASLLKGFDYREATFLGGILVVLLPARAQFYRRSSLLNEPLSRAWLLSMLLILAGSVVIGLFRFRHVEYAHQLWWQFAVAADAPRFLRATVGTAGFLLCVGLLKLLRPAPPTIVSVTSEEWADVTAVVRSSRRTLANLAFLGDKRFVFNNSRTAFIMYAVKGRSWVALGDPVGPPDTWSDLIRRFRAQCDHYDGWPVFYNIDRTQLPLYLDAGLTAVKIGEEAKVALRDFTLEGAAQQSLRYTHHRAQRDGCTFAYVPPVSVPVLLPELQAISDAWLTSKHTREKGFSLGRFDAAYLRYFPVGLVRLHGRVVAFTNVWLGAEQEEVSLDLMRFHPDAPRSSMEYLFLELMQWGQQAGYQWFSLGMVPLSGLQTHPLATAWDQFGVFLFRHGEHFYNFRGLREYKEKFHPQWEPKYLASPGGIVLPSILTDVVTLIAGGWRGMLAK